MKTFDDLLLAYTGRDAAYHERAQTTGLDFARHVYAAMSAAPTLQLPAGLELARETLTEHHIAQMWAPSPGGDVSRPILGWNKVVAFARAVEASALASVAAEIERLSVELRRERDEAIASADHAIRMFDEMRAERDAAHQDGIRAAAERDELQAEVERLEAIERAEPARRSLTDEQREAYERVREEFEQVKKAGRLACVGSAMLNVDALLRAHGITTTDQEGGAA